MLPLIILKDINMYFYNCKNDIKKILLQITSIFQHLPSQLLITGHRGVEKTFF